MSFAFNPIRPRSLTAQLIERVRAARRQGRSASVGLGALAALSLAGLGPGSHI